MNNNDRTAVLTFDLTRDDLDDVFKNAETPADLAEHADRIEIEHTETVCDRKNAD